MNQSSSIYLPNISINTPPKHIKLIMGHHFSLSFPSAPSSFLDLLLFNSFVSSLFFTGLLSSIYYSSSTRLPAFPLGPSPFPKEINLGTVSIFSSDLKSKSGLKLGGFFKMFTACSCFTLLRYFCSPNYLNFQALIMS